MSQIDVLEKAASFFKSFDRKGGDPNTTHYCPGCGHGILHKLIAEALDDFGLQNRTIMVNSVGCSVFMYYYFQTAAVSVQHGRAPAVGTGIARSNPDAITISYQGDGDLAAIGTSHTIHAANRGENMIVFFVNNNNYGMTGGQMAPTTLIGQKTITSPAGRSLLNEGAPIKMTEMIATLEAPILVARTSVHSSKNIRQCRELIRRGFEAQRDKKGYVFLEVLSPCPTNWHKSPSEACEWIENTVLKEYPLGVFKDTIDSEEPKNRDLETPSFEEMVKRLGIESMLSENKDVFVKNETELEKPLKMKVAGFGGQGILSLGLALANLSMRKGLQVSWLPSYGPEMRGGVANCSVVISENPIGSPTVENPDVLIVMNKPSMFAFAPKVPENGHIFYNSSMVDEIPENLKAKLHPVDATNDALRLGNVKIANTILLGKVSTELGLFTKEELRNFVNNLFPGEANTKIRELNLKALE